MFFNTHVQTKSFVCFSVQPDQSAEYRESTKDLYSEIDNAAEEQEVFQPDANIAHHSKCSVLLQ